MIPSLRTCDEIVTMGCCDEVDCDDGVYRVARVDDVFGREFDIASDLTALSGDFG